MCIMKMQIFLSRGKSTTNMSLALIQLKYLACLSRQLGVDCRKPLGDILMYGCGDLEWFLSWLFRMHLQQFSLCRLLFCLCSPILQ